MKKANILSITGGVLSCVSLTLVFADQRLAAACVGLAAYFVTMRGVKTNGTTHWKIYLFLLSALIFGYALCPRGGFFCMIACLFFAALVMGVRLLFFDRLGHTRALWLESVIFLVAAGYYVFGNIYDGSGWMSWALPAPSVGMAGYMAIGWGFDAVFFNKKFPDKYGVEAGVTAPEIALPDEDGNIVKLSDYRGKRHVLLIFVRGDWCPTCHIMLRSYEKNKERFAEKNIMLLAIGPDNVAVNKEMVRKLDLDYKLLSDLKHEAVKAYGMQLQGNYPQTEYEEGIPLPASFLVDINGRILYTSNPKMAGQILNPETIIPIVEKLHYAGA
jgi:peroxiredoxin